MRGHWLCQMTNKHSMFVNTKDVDIYYPTIINLVDII